LAADGDEPGGFRVAWLGREQPMVPQTMTDATTSSDSTSQSSAAQALPPTDADDAGLLGWPLAVGLTLFVVAVLVGAYYVDPLVSLLSGVLVALGVAATFVGVWLDDRDGAAAIGAPVVLFAAVILFVIGVATFAGIIEIPGLPANPNAEPEYLPDALRGPQSRLDAPPARDNLFVSIARF
jgi:hypothetical protein